MGFLDGEGLAYFWGKVRSALAGKQNTITPGDGLEKNGDILSVTTPVRGVFTQEEFDALPEAERNKGLYVIPDGGNGDESGGSSGGEVYSTEETRIGTWIDGKPLYRIVFFKDTSALSGGNINGFFDISNLNIDAVVNLHGGTSGRKASDPIHTIPYSFGSTYAAVAITNHATLSLSASGVPNNCCKSFHIVLEYTKTTDEGGAA